MMNKLVALSYFSFYRYRSSLAMFFQHKASSCISQVINPWCGQQRPISIRIVFAEASER